MERIVLPTSKLGSPMSVFDVPPFQKPFRGSPLGFDGDPSTAPLQFCRSPTPSNKGPTLCSSVRRAHCPVPSYFSTMRKAFSPRFQNSRRSTLRHFFSLWKIFAHCSNPAPGAPPISGRPPSCALPLNTRLITRLS